MRLACQPRHQLTIAMQFVSMRGFLVNVGGPDGFYWNTSLRRDDTGNGACEVFYVESIEAKTEPALLAHAH